MCSLLNDLPNIEKQVELVNWWSLVLLCPALSCFTHRAKKVNFAWLFPNRLSTLQGRTIFFQCCFPYTALCLVGSVLLIGKRKLKLKLRLYCNLKQWIELTFLWNSLYFHPLQLHYTQKHCSSS